MMLSHVTIDVFNSGDFCHFEFYFMTKIAIHIVVGASTTFIYLLFCNSCYLILLSTFIRFLKFSLFFPCKNNHKFPINLSLKASIYSYSTTKEFNAWNEVSHERQEFRRHATFNPSPFYWYILCRFKFAKWVCVSFFIHMDSHIKTLAYCIRS